MNRRESRAQRLSIENLLNNIENKYLTRQNLYNRFLHNRDDLDPAVIDIIGRIDIIDSVRENVRTALQFGHYRRAAWYLSLLVRLCEEYFN